MSPPAAKLPCPTLVCFAVREEAQLFSVPPELRGEVEVLITGMGFSNARSSAAAALERFQPRTVLTCGFAGGLKPGLPVGTLLYAADPASPLDKLLTQVGARPAIFLHSNRIAVTAREKTELYHSTKADAVEMESAAIRELCAQRNIPCAILRTISDAAEDDLPLDFNVLLTERFAIDYRKLGWALVKAPGRIRGLLELRRRTRLAARHLGQALEFALSHRNAL